MRRVVTLTISLSFVCICLFGSVDYDALQDANTVYAHDSAVANHAVALSQKTTANASAIASAINRHRLSHRLSHRHAGGIVDPMFMQGPPGDTEPVPIPGGVVFPPLVHAFFPGFLGEPIDHEPSTITNFRGRTALAYHAGTATGSDGNEYLFFTDMRVMQGEYVSADGTHHRGPFVLI